MTPSVFQATQHDGVRSSPASAGKEHVVIGKIRPRDSSRLFPNSISWLHLCHQSPASRNRRDLRRAATVESNVDATGMMDVKNKRCEGEGCLKRGLFGFSGEKARFCSAHRLHGKSPIHPVTTTTILFVSWSSPTPSVSECGSLTNPSVACAAYWSAVSLAQATADNACLKPFPTEAKK